MSFQHNATAVPFQNVKITSAFWNGRLDVVRKGSLPAIYEQMKITGRWDSLKLHWKPGDPNKPHQFWDSDIAKWLEAACYALTLEHDPSLARLVEEAVDMIRGAQQDDGYLNTYYTVVEPGKRWTNIAWSHEMYCAGHLLEAGLAHHTYSGSYRLLGPILKYVKHIGSVFGPEPGKKKGYPGHEELELALLKAYKVTKDESLLSLARYFIEERGKRRPEGHYFDIEAKERGEPPRPGPGRGAPYSYHQADKPIHEITSIEGHSVRAMYLLTAVASLANITEDFTSLEDAKRLWKSTFQKKMYVTGGLGSMPEWEGFGPDYYFPNEAGYLETCAAIGLVLFASQLSLITFKEWDYNDVVDLSIYNAVLAGVSLDGKSFFYENPLATVGKYHSRSPWFEVSCCPPNVARLLTSIGQYIYTVNKDNIICVKRYISSATTITLSDGSVVTITQEGSEPFTGRAEFTIDGPQHTWGQIFFHFPLGASVPTISSTCAITQDARPNGVIVTTSSDRPERIVIVMTCVFKVRRLYPHELDLDNRGCVAIARGPLIYCAETTDNEAIGDLRRIRLRDDAHFDEIADDTRFSGMALGVTPIVLQTKVDVIMTDSRIPGGTREETLTLIPYFMWANRGKSDLRIWLPRARMQVG